MELKRIDHKLTACILVKEENYERALIVLTSAGYTVVLLIEER